MSGILEEFKKFIMRGNVVDLAVGIIIGTAFKGITTSLVKDVVMPPIGQVTGGLDFSNWVIPLDWLNFGRASTEVATLNIGNFVNVVIDFGITAAAIFVMIKVVNKLDEAVDEIGDLLDGDEEEVAVEHEPEPEPETEPETEQEPEPTTDEKILAVLERISAQLDKAG
ncbi:MAG: large conductance mechanosensitive channel protein MscL [Chloroflexi bacterium]|nr:large conductance mechanosensitive channel protein MscL [Chloroflexota bacterium]